MKIINNEPREISIELSSRLFYPNQDFVHRVSWRTVGYSEIVLLSLDKSERKMGKGIMKWRAYAMVKSAFKSGSRLCQNTSTGTAMRTGRLLCCDIRREWTFRMIVTYRKLKKRCPWWKCLQVVHFLVGSLSRCLYVTVFTTYLPIFKLHQITGAGTPTSITA